MKRYDYVGPEEVRLAAQGEASGVLICSADDVAVWVREHEADRDSYGVGVTFVVGLDRFLRVASRRSEHVACAGGQPVLSAGEMFFSTDRPRWLLRYPISRRGIVLSPRLGEPSKQPWTQRESSILENSPMFLRSVGVLRVVSGTS